MAELRKASPGSKQRDEALGLNLSGFSLAVLKGICEHSSVQLLSDGSLLLERRPVPLAVVARLLRLDFIEKVEGGVKATEAGRSFVRRHMSSKLEAGYGVSSGAQAGTRGKAKGRGQEGAEDPGIDPYRSQHMQLATDDRILPDGTRGRVRVNGAESPLGWLVRRRGRDGRPMLSQCQFDAGERLREDFERASMGARITSSLMPCPHRGSEKAPQMDNLSVICSLMPGGV
ncbi:hypothetical protein JCM17844_06870 [Iodidimonas gelatinilytica]|uniref:DUF6456 domain-containing protein n=1 Tax=Iodidimonas gelatinilytica TaxID=1236966 RepID=A0A5A7MM60_9PROT|nr:DUF6456 domain-containing protein [Iodidimonas gelatinilytica]GEQ97050.1 hypothetical protein JCM17844_06870 [Iodidimonas gelatinilytica]